MSTAFTSSTSVLHVQRRARTQTCHLVTMRVSAPAPAPTPKVRQRTPAGGARAPKAPAKLQVEGDFLESTLQQQAMVWGFFALSTMEFAHLFASTDSPAVLALGVLGGWLFADLGTGIYHWGVDNYGSGATPLLGRQIEAFQGHHGTPWTIAQRAFANNLAALTVPTAPQMAALLFLEPPVALGAFYASALLFIVLSQELHRQAHMARSAPAFRALQRAGLALKPKMHLAHHNSPYGDNYCIVSGVWNPLLDRTRFFRRMEKVVYHFTGNEPIAWKLDERIRNEALNL